MPLSEHDEHALRVGLAAATNYVQEWCERKGWANDGRSFGDCMALLMSEPIEALEAYRANGLEEWVTFQPVINGVKMPKMTADQCRALGIDPSELRPRREGVGPEFAGTFVRLLDDCGRHDINLAEQFLAEMNYNEAREFRHGGKAL